MEWATWHNHYKPHNARELLLQCWRQSLDNVQAGINLYNWTTVGPNHSLEQGSQHTYTTETTLRNTDKALLYFVKFVSQVIYPCPPGLLH